MKRIIYLLALLSLMACSDNMSSSVTSGDKSGLFKANMGDKQYEVGISCIGLDTAHYQFKSDNTRSIDSNGDDLVIAGVEIKKHLALTILDDGVLYSNGAQPVQWSKNSNGITGSGELYLSEGGLRHAYKTTFEVICK